MRVDNNSGSASGLARGDLVATVVLPMRNARATVRTQVQAVLGQDCCRPWELVIVDNDSDDDSYEVAQAALRAAWPSGLVDADVVKYNDRLGYASPRNFGARRGTGRYVVFCDADDEVDPTWLRHLVDAGDHGHELVASRVVSISASDSCPETTITGDARLPEMFGVPVSHTGGMLCSRRLFSDLGGFDPYFDLGGEDVDFSLRARLAGIEPHLAPDAVYFARERETARGRMRQGYRNGRTKVRLFERHRVALHLPQSSWGLAQRQVRDLIRKLPALLDPERRPAYAATAGVTIARFFWSARLRVRHF